jgi:formyl-CoA transferase
MERRDELIRRMSEAFRTKTLAEWLERLQGRDIPYSTVNDVAQALEDPQVLHRGMKVTIPGPSGDVTCIGTPYKLSSTPVTFDAPAPALGEHTDAILAGSGLSPAEIAELHEAGAV